MADKKTVLVIDDEPSFLDLTTHFFRAQAVGFLGASNGPEALKVLEEHAEEIGLIFLDLALPGMNGYEIFEAIRTNPDTAHIPVIVITALGHSEHSRTLKAGIDDFVVKPFRPTQMKEMLARFGLIDESK